MNFHPTSPWTAERVELLKKLWADGVSASKIESSFAGTGITRNAIIGKVHRMKSPKRETKEHLPRHKRAKRQKRPAITPTVKPRPIITELDAHLPKDQSSFAVSIRQLERHHCRWILGDAKPAKYCGARTVECESWCLRHYRLVYQPVRVRSEAA